MITWTKPALVVSLLMPMLALSGRGQDRNDQACNLPPSIKVDAYEDQPIGGEMIRLEKIIPVMEAHDHSHGFIVTYAGPESSLAAAQNRADLAKRQLLEKHQWINQSDGLNSRLNTLVCGYRETPATELWVTPIGAAPPTCSPTVTQPEKPAKRPPRRRA